MRFTEFHINEIPDDGNRAGQKPNKLIDPDATDPRGKDQRNTPTATELSQGSSGDYENQKEVSALQAKLEELGYNVGHTGVDGKYGSRTARAVAAAKKDFNIKGNGSSISTADVAKLMSASPVKNPTPTGNEGHHYTSRASGSDNLDDVEFAQGSGKGRVRMSNSSATRNKGLQSNLMSILDSAAEAAGVDVVVFSGGQDVKGQGSRRTGSVRHDAGRAADIHIYSGGKRLRTDREDPIVANFIAQAVAAGAKGIGAGPGYMGGVGIHVDILGDRAGANYWGKSGRTANTPGYVIAAYRSGKSGNIA